MQRYGRYGVAAVGGPEAIADRARDARGISAFALVLALSRERSGRGAPVTSVSVE